MILVTKTSDQARQRVCVCVCVVFNSCLRLTLAEHVVIRPVAYGENVRRFSSRALLVTLHLPFVKSENNKINNIAIQQRR